MSSGTGDVASAVAITSVLNFRDVAQSINDKSGRATLRKGQLFRSARPDSATDIDRRLLKDTYKIRTIIDLRSKTELIEAAKKADKVAKLVQPSVVPSSQKAVSKAFHIPGIDYAEINLNGKGFERHLVWQLSYANLARLVGYMATGYRLEGISVLGKNVLLPRGLVGLGIDTLDHSGPEVKEVFDILADPHSYPVLLHCTQGKDRTGITVLLALLLCGIDVEPIVEDYVQSERELEPEYEEKMKEIRSIGLDESFAKCPPDFVPRVTAHINTLYGGIEAYLLHIGITSDQISSIRKQLLPA